MAKKKPVRTRGKISLSEYFKELKQGDKVALVEEKSVRCNFPTRMQGRTGKVISTRGNSYFVEIKDQNKEKKFLVKPVHLKKLK